VPVTKQYNLIGIGPQGAVMLCDWEGNQQAWWKVMAAYRRLDNL